MSNTLTIEDLANQMRQLMLDQSKLVSVPELFSLATYLSAIGMQVAFNAAKQVALVLADGDPEVFNKAMVSHHLNYETVMTKMIKQVRNDLVVKVEFERLMLPPPPTAPAKGLRPVLRLVKNEQPVMDSAKDSG